MTAATRSRSAVLVAAAFLLAAFVTAAAGADRADPSFVPSGLIEAGGIPCAFTVAKLDGDANPDLAAANCYANSLTVLLGDGAGHFRARTRLADSRRKDPDLRRERRSQR